jgi:hypothetical protein
MQSKAWKLAKQNDYPLYIPSKGRWDTMLTSKALTQMGVPHNIVVEPQEVDIYKDASKNLLATIIELDMSYKDSYEYCDNFGTSISTGSGPARNFIWDHSISCGHEWHWIMDDNIRAFGIKKNGKRGRTTNRNFWKYMENFMHRYENVSMGGPNYTFFVFGTNKPFHANTRIYSCNFIKNNIPFRWRGRYNEDTILSLDMLKQGHATILFNGFIQYKMGTQSIKGGNTDTVYKHGTFDKSKMIENVHPDVAKISLRYGRWHHHVNYNKFKKIKLVKKENYEPIDHEWTIKS